MARSNEVEQQPRPGHVREHAARYGEIPAALEPYGDDAPLAHDQVPHDGAEQELAAVSLEHGDQGVRQGAGSACGEGAAFADCRAGGLRTRKDAGIMIAAAITARMSIVVRQS